MGRTASQRKARQRRAQQERLQQQQRKQKQQKLQQQQQKGKGTHPLKTKQTFAHASQKNPHPSSTLAKGEPLPEEVSPEKKGGNYMYLRAQPERESVPVNATRLPNVSQHFECQSLLFLNELAQMTHHDGTTLSTRPIEKSTKDHAVLITQMLAEKHWKRSQEGVITETQSRMKKWRERKEKETQRRPANKKQMKAGAHEATLRASKTGHQILWYCILAALECEARRLARGEVFLTRAIVLVPPKPILLGELLLARAWIRLRLQKYQKAVEDSSTYLKLSRYPERKGIATCDALYRRSCGYFFLGKYEKCLQDLQSIRALSESYRIFLPQDVINFSNILHTKLKNEGKECVKKNMQDWQQRGQWPPGVSKPYACFEPINRDYQATRTTMRRPGSPVEVHHADLPPLIPVGEAVDHYLFHGNYIPSDDKHIFSHAAESQYDRALVEKEKGNAAFGNQQYHLALAYYSRAIKLHALESIFFSNRALVYLKLNRCHECVTDCTTSLQLRPSIKAFHRRAVAYVGLKQYERAAVQYRKALQIEPRNTSCLNELAKCVLQVIEQRQAWLRDLSQQEEAYKNQKRVISPSSSDGEWNAKKMEQKKLAWRRLIMESQDEYEQLSAMVSDIHPIPRQLVKKNTPSKKSTSTAPEKAKNQSPALDDREIRLRNMMLSREEEVHDVKEPYLIDGDPVVYYTDLLKKNPKHTEALLARAAVRVQKGELELAVEDYRQVVSLHPDIHTYQHELQGVIQLCELRIGNMKIHMDS